MFGKGVFSRGLKATGPEDSTPNLIPVMNLFVAMIPMLLTSAVFVHLRILNASVPTISDDNTIEAQKRKVIATLRIREDGLSLAAGNEFVSEAEEQALRFAFPQRALGDYDYKALTAALAQIKRKYDLSDTIVLVPDKVIPYAVLIKAMDASRRVPGSEDTCNKPECFLFPNVVVSSLVE